MKIEPLAKLTRPLRSFLKATIIVTALAVLAGIYDYFSSANLPPGIDPNESFLPSDAVSGLVAVAQFVLLILTGVTFLRWVHRCSSNLRALSGESLRFTPGWAVGWYFIPFANLYKPYQVMKELWKVSHRSDPDGQPLLVWWWSLWIVSNAVGNFAFRLIMRADSAAGYASSALAYIASDGIDVVLSIVSLSLVTRIGDAYARNIVEPASTRPSAPPSSPQA